MSTGADGTGAVEQAQLFTSAVVDPARIGSFLPLGAVHFDVLERFAQL